MTPVIESESVAKWKMVPLVPTAKQVVVGACVHKGCTNDQYDMTSDEWNHHMERANAIYREMVNQIPHAPIVSNKAVETIVDTWRVVDQLGTGEMLDMSLPDAVRALYDKAIMDCPPPKTPHKPILRREDRVFSPDGEGVIIEFGGVIVNEQYEQVLVRLKDGMEKWYPVVKLEYIPTQKDIVLQDIKTVMQALEDAYAGCKGEALDKGAAYLMAREVLCRIHEGSLSMVMMKSEYQHQYEVEAV